MPRTWPETQRSEVTEVRTPEGTNDQASGGRGHLERQEEGLEGAPGVLPRRLTSRSCVGARHGCTQEGHVALEPACRHTLLPALRGVETSRVAWRWVKSPRTRHCGTLLPLLYLFLTNEGTPFRG